MKSSSIPILCKICTVYLIIVRWFNVAETFCPTATTTTITTSRRITSTCRGSCQTEMRRNALHLLSNIQIPLLLYRTTTRLAGEGSSFRSEDNKNDDDDDDGDNTGASSSVDEDEDEDEDSIMEQYDHEETLLVMNLRPKQHDGISDEECLSQISQYIQSFPFVALLPVQPLQYIPTKDGGVEIKFLRKKTVTKSGIEGGVRFFVRSINLQQQQQRDNDDDTTANNNNNKDDDNNNSNNNDNIIEVIAKRNSEGQTISKMFTEKLLIQGFVSGMTEYEDGENKNNSGPADKVIKTRIESPTKSIANIESIFHKWMR